MGDPACCPALDIFNFADIGLGVNRVWAPYGGDILYLGLTSVWYAV